MEHYGNANWKLIGKDIDRDNHRIVMTEGLQIPRGDMLMKVTEINYGDDKAVLNMSFNIVMVPGVKLSEPTDEKRNYWSIQRNG